ncbi:MAG: aminoglycoside phosphotransferase family protein [Gammaproteobacteria bacterium]|nr:aminoglycoside phosphotransferase family protein [Gammaproteobacteria bacterium]
MDINHNIEEIVNSFHLSSNYLNHQELLNGHINKTYLVTLKNGDKFVLQRINDYVFKKPEEVMENIISITSYIKSNNGSALDFIRTKDNKYYYYNKYIGYYRLYKYIEDSHTESNPSDLNVIKEIGYGFGTFINSLDGFDASNLHVTIPDFHNTIKRFETLKEVVKENPLLRVNNTKEIIDEFLKYETLSSELTLLMKNGQLPLRVTHNDTKSDNVLIDNKTDEAKVIIDLDTVMPGLISYDFGDSIRTSASNVKEDELDLSKVYIDINKFKAYSEGFLKAVKSSLLPLEKETLVLGAISITIELGVRFLTDYITGDKYFKIDYEKHNLDRALNQLTLAKDMIDKRDKLETIIKEL